MRGIVTKLDRIVTMGLFGTVHPEPLVTRGFEFGVGFVVRLGMAA